MRAGLTALHRWVGLALALVLLVVALSGVLLLAKGPYYRWQYPSFGQPIAAQDRAGWPAMLEAITRRFGDDVRTIKVPQPGMHVFQVWLADGSEAFVDARAGTLLDRWHPTDRLPALLFDLHVHLMAGERGELINGAIALLTIAFLVIGGGLIWWPRRASMPLRAVWPRSWAPGALLRSHAAVGVVTAGPLLVFLLTGAGMAFSASVMPMLSRLLDAAPPTVVRPQVASDGRGHVPWAVALARLEQAMAALDTPPRDGEAQLVFITPPRVSGTAMVARVRLPGEWHPNGRSIVVLHPHTGDILQTMDARREGAGTRLGHALYPIHAARIGSGPSWLLVALAILAGLGLAVLSGSGLVTWVQRRVRRRGTSADVDGQGRARKRSMAVARTQ